MDKKKPTPIYLTDKEKEMLKQKAKECKISLSQYIAFIMTCRILNKGYQELINTIVTIVKYARATLKIEYKQKLIENEYTKKFENKVSKKLKM
ncbi:MAG: hypothetical protein SOW25_01210 [Helicobacter sp.]|nr:hypothetical protein [Helicobacteraceae bacterium]MDY3112931.1 hypothetical protein [Helicobacter sp.]